MSGGGSNIEGSLSPMTDKLGMILAQEAVRPLGPLCRLVISDSCLRSLLVSCDPISHDAIVLVEGCHARHSGKRMFGIGSGHSQSRPDIRICASAI